MSSDKIIKYIYRMLPIRMRCLLLSLYKGEKIQKGDGVYIHPSVHLLGKGSIRIGSNSCISEGCWLNVNHRSTNEINIEIGSNTFIGKQNFFSSGKKIVINDYVLTTYGCKFLGSGHIIDNPEVPYISTGTTSVDSIIIGVNCVIGSGVTILGNVQVGHGSIIGSDSLVLQDIPPFSIAFGNPAKIVKRYSFTRKSWIPIAEFVSEDDLNIPEEHEYLTKLKAISPDVDMPWIAAGKNMGDL